MKPRTPVEDSSSDNLSWKGGEPQMRSQVFSGGYDLKWERSFRPGFTPDCRRELVISLGGESPPSFKGDWARTSRAVADGDREDRSLASVEVTPALWEAFTDWSVPEARGGQIWRVQWKDSAALAVVEPRRDRSTVSALPLSEDPQFATDTDLILQPDETPLGIPLMAEVALEMVLHQRVLDRCLGSLEESALNDLRRLRNAFVHSQPSGLPIGRVGPPVTHELDERLQYRSEQREMHALLIFADWYQAPGAGTSAAELVRRCLAGRKWSLQQLADASGVSVQELLRIRRGEYLALSGEQMNNLAKALDVAPEELEAALAERLPPEVQEAIDHPHHKARVYTWAEKWNLDEVEARRRIGRSLIAMLRRAKQMSVAEWSRLLEEQFPL